MWYNLSELIIVASGTATLEASLLTKPMIIVYKVFFLTYLLGRYLINVDFIGMTNLVAEKQVVPELIQYNVKAKILAAMVLDFFDNPVKLERIKSDLSMVKSKLGNPPVTPKIAKSALNFLF